MAVVPTFRPPSTTLDLVRTLAKDCDFVVVSDDASPCTSDHILHNIDALPSVRLLRHRDNRGIARGLNNGLQQAAAEGAAWLLTVDQDSHLGHDYIARLVHQARSRTNAGEALGALGAETIVDAAAEIRYPLSGAHGMRITEEVIQTGTLWSVRALTAFGGFDESFGIDGVDAAACLALPQRVIDHPIISFRGPRGRVQSKRQGSRRVATPPLLVSVLRRTHTERAKAFHEKRELF